jgi:hypothetical protein
MGLLDRLRGAASIDAVGKLMAEETSPELGFRIVLYQNPKRIADAFAQRLPNVVERVTNGELTAEVGGGVAAIFATKVGGKLAASEKIEVTPMMQALLLEEAAAEEGWMVDLRDRPGRLGDQLVRFTGNGRMIGPGQPLGSLSDFDLDAELAHTLQAIREQQEASMRARDPDHPGAFVHVALGAGPIATIANFRGADENYESYSSTPPYGVLGHYEGGPHPLTRVAPLMLWHLTSDAFPSEQRRATDIALDASPNSPIPRGSTLPRPSAIEPEIPSLGDYIVLGTIHEGPYGRIMRCWRKDVPCVVKETQAQASRTTLEALTKLNCPNLAAPVRVWEHEGILYEELPYIDGIPLVDLVRRGGTPVRGALLRTMQRQLAGVLSVLHAAGFVHRDIHPENVYLVVRSGTHGGGTHLKWAWDAFSSATKQMETSRAESTQPPQWAYDPLGNAEQSFNVAWIVGDCTFAVAGADMSPVEFRHGVYTAPEQAGAQASAANDMFSLGATLYYAMAAHEPPPRSGSGQPTATPIPPDNCGGYYISQYVAKLLSADPGERPEATEQLREGSLTLAYCGALALGDDMFLVMDTWGSHSALVHGRAAARALTGEES